MHIQFDFDIAQCSVPDRDVMRRLGCDRAAPCVLDYFRRCCFSQTCKLDLDPYTAVLPVSAGRCGQRPKSVPRDAGEKITKVCQGVAL